MSRRLALTLGGVALAALGAITALAATSQPAPLPAEAVGITITGTYSGSTLTYTVNLNNFTAQDINDLFISASIPRLAEFKSASQPTGAVHGGHENNTSWWLAEKVPANGTLGPFIYVVTRHEAYDFTAHPFVSWKLPTAGSVVGADVAHQTVMDTAAPRRGCLSCHVLVYPDGRYTLPYEAKERAELRGGGHPGVALDGTSIKPTDEVGPEVCLQCHAPGTGDREGKGNIAPWALRDIVHPAHMFSNGFKNTYGGNCFTCHNVQGDGTFVLLGQDVVTNEKGVPTTAPIPKAIPPSEGKR